MISLQPLEERYVHVEFKSRIAGQRNENLVLYATNSSKQSVDVHSFSGPPVLIPIVENIMFPVLSPNTSSIIMVPFINLTTESILITISIPLGTPFLLEAAGTEISNNRRNSVIGADLNFKTKNINDDKSTGLQITIGPKLTLMVKVFVNSPQSGAFRVPVTTTIKGGFFSKTMIPQVYLNSLIVDPEKILPAMLGPYRTFFSNPSEKTMTEIPIGPPISRPDTGNDGFPVFEMEPEMLLVYFKNQSDSDIVSLTNSSSSDQPYHIILSKPFYTSIELDGVIEANSILEIPVFMMDDDSFDRFRKETHQYTIFGSLTVLRGNTEKTTFAKSTLIGLANQLLTIQVADNDKTYVFPHVPTLAKSTRRFILRNKCPAEVFWEGKLVNSDPSLQTCPYIINYGKITLKPFESVFIDVYFQSSLNGQFNATLLMEYSSTVKKRGHDNGKYTIPSLAFTSIVGTVELTVAPSFVHFGDLNAGEISVKTLTIANSFSRDVKCTLTSSNKSVWVNSEFTVLALSKIEIPITFSPQYNKNYSAVVLLAYEGCTKNIPIYGYARTEKPASCKVVSKKEDVESVVVNLASDYSDSIIDLGFIEQTNPKIKTLQFLNNSHSDIIIENIDWLDKTDKIEWKIDDGRILENPLKSICASILDSTDIGEQDEKCVDVDFDEIMARTNLAKKAQTTTTTPVVNSVPPRKKKGRRGTISEVIDEQVRQNLKRKFPIRIPALQEIKISLTYLNCDVVNIEKEFNFSHLSRDS